MKRRKRLQSVLWSTDIDEILNAGVYVEPVARLDLATAAYTKQDRRSYLLLGQTDPGRFGAVDGELEPL